MVHHQGDDTLCIEKPNSALLGSLLSFSLRSRSFHQHRETVSFGTHIAQPKFEIASWSFPDQYGQGVYALRPYENSTGSWLNATSTSLYYYDACVIEWDAGVFLKLNVYCLFNSTLTGATSLENGLLLLRHSVTVTDNYGVVFTKENFTVSGYQVWSGQYMDVYSFGNLEFPSDLR